jgi:hypothetical protein
MEALRRVSGATDIGNYTTGNPVISCIETPSHSGQLQGVMNSKKRFVLGLVSSLFLACGFVRAAERLDPMTQSSHGKPITMVSAVSCGGDCNPPCWVDDSGN